MKAFYDWATHWQVPAACMNDLLHRLGMGYQSPQRNDIAGMSEAAVSSRVRLEAAYNGDLILWRNNVGALKDSRGVPVRYGLCNDSKAMNDEFKSSDLIGIRRVLITQDIVGQTIGQFVAREVKESDWKYTGDEHEIAQANFNGLVISYGGDAAFTNGEGSL